MDSKYLSICVQELTRGLTKSQGCDAGAPLGLSGGLWRVLQFRSLHKDKETDNKYHKIL